MRVGGFKVGRALTELRAPQAVAILRPWLDAGSVGTLVLQRLEAGFRAKELARLEKPGDFYDFTRYRPESRYRGNVRRLIIPNTTINYARVEGGNDFIFLHLLEPHMSGEAYADSVWQLLKKLQIQRYCLLGSFYDMVPHTRPILVSGGASSPNLEGRLRQLGVNQSHYEGPTTICNLISQEAEKAGIETLTLLVHLPHYIELDEDYLGMTTLLEIMHSLYGTNIDESDLQAAQTQLKNLDAAISQDRKLKSLLAQLESQYDSLSETAKSEEELHLSPEIDKFLKQMEERFRDS
jgi:hypothetical protein